MVTHGSSPALTASVRLLCCARFFYFADFNHVLELTKSSVTTFIAGKSNESVYAMSRQLLAYFLTKYNDGDVRDLEVVMSSVKHELCCN